MKESKGAMSNNGAGASAKTIYNIVLKHERKKLELKRAKASVFLDAIADKCTVAVAWQMVASYPEVQLLEDELAVLTAKRLAYVHTYVAEFETEFEG